MPIFLSKPSVKKMEEFVKAQKKIDYTYLEQAATLNDELPKGYNHDRYRCFLGNGELCWERAKKAIQNWQMFPQNWTYIYPNKASQLVGEEVAVCIRLAFIYWLNGARIVYTLDEPMRYGFAYGTLESHAEKGEELFMVSRNEDGDVFFELIAFSQPQHWLAKIGKPMVRLLQKRFARDAQATMQLLCSLEEEDPQRLVPQT